MGFFGFLLVNTFCTMLTAIIIYYFLKINFKVEGNLLFLVLSFGLINGIVASLWTNLFELSHNLDALKSVLLLFISILAVKISLKINWLKAILGVVVVVILGTGVGNVITIIILKNITFDYALSHLPTYIVANILVNVFTILFVAFIQIIKVLITNLSKGANEPKN